MSNDEEISDYPPAVPPTRDEVRATAELVNFLEFDLGVDPRRVLVIFKSGTVYLQGTVQSHERKREIEEMLRHQSGVLEIVNRLSIRPDSQDF